MTAINMQIRTYFSRSERGFELDVTYFQETSKERDQWKGIISGSSMKRPREFTLMSGFSRQAYVK